MLTSAATGALIGTVAATVYLLRMRSIAYRNYYGRYKKRLP